LGDKVRLLGYNLESGFRPGHDIHLTLFWQCLAEMDQDYTVFTHLIDSSNRIWGQHDSQPQGGQHPTSQWVEGEVGVDEHELILADDVLHEEYQIEVGMYDWGSGERLAVSENRQSVPENRVILETVHLRSRS